MHVVLIFLYLCIILALTLLHMIITSTHVLRWYTMSI